ncbi:TBC1 domain family member 5 homolog A-like [Impatiens glandulifera]|uniref:TBC1 domain family member 5 homolog A-like n=1 Tax=Impatiens glandulifera TaxID=253017 RepID=UPI001FB095E6|nr:TBC1 domain family member 5 homolog A-like [Impatiens glandulifera]
MAPIQRLLLESAAAVSSPSTPLAEISVTDARLFSNLRGIRWRIDLGILPSTSSIHHLRLTTADSRRRYARLRRQLLVVVHPHERRNNSPEPVIDNPLSQNPVRLNSAVLLADSKWGQFFQTAELERTLDQDLSCLCNEEQTSYFQTAGCQSLLRRILLLWCLEHPECGYRQGMLELLVPLLYVLQADRDHLSKTRKYYEDQFTTDNFNSCKFDQDFTDESKEFPTWKVRSYDELDHTAQEIVSLTDAYGTEGELGVVISSEKYLEHDAYSMFDALMNTTIDFFLPSVVESCSVWYRLLSVVDPTLFTHLVELRVEPQYFALRWLRVLFGREFSLNNLLIIWDNIFQRDHNRKLDNDQLFGSSRGVFISAFAVSMIIYLRPSLLASENTTSCLQKLLNFPNDVMSIGKLLDTAKSLSVLALDRCLNSTVLDPFCVDLSGCVSPTSPLSLETDSYWEGRWKILNDEEEEEKSGFETTKIPIKNDDKLEGSNNAKERKPLLWGKFQWLLKLGKNTSKVLSSNQGDTMENIRQSMLQHIQVIESCLEEEPCQGSSLSEREHIAVMEALKALRKSSNLLSVIRDNNFLS